MGNTTQVRKKLYKAGKNWVVGGIITAGAALAFVAGTTTASADSSQNAATAQVTAPATTTTTTTDAPATSATTTAAQSDTSSVTTQKAPVATTAPTQTAQPVADTTPAAPQTGYVEKDGAWYYVNADQSYAKGLTTIAGHLQYFDATGRQTKGA